MKKKLIIFNTLIVVASLVLMFALGILVTRSDHYEYAEQKIKDITRIYAGNYNDSPDFVKKISADIRVTVVNADGTVIADSDQVDISALENHGSREEIVSAAAGSPYAVTRYSDTLGVEMMYYAEKVPVGDSFVFVRVAIPVESVNSYVFKSVVPLVFIMLLALAGSMIACVLLGGGLMRPLEKVKFGLAQIGEGTYTKISPTTDDDEINHMLSDINDISTRLQSSILSAKEEREKLDYILNNISDGIVVTDSSLTVVAVNRSAQNIFGIRESVGKEVQALTPDKQFISAMTDCSQNKKGSIFETEIDGEWYLCTVHYTENELIIAVLTNITAAKNSENVRLEFFANASHELKTPLTAIKGFNDMISLQCKDNTLLGYSGHIEKETDRMLALIDDMLDLSKLENSHKPDAMLADIHLGEVSEEVVEALKLLAEEKKVTVTVSGDVSVHAEREHMYELIKNLTENAIRYNNDGGTAKISLSYAGGKPKLTVSDNGIGIDSEHQSRIFERFYRVDKSRSRATGGTGLGLAIVKHICELYDAEISLASKLGSGTTVTVIFPS